MASLFRRALTILGACLPADLRSRTDTQITNIAARKVLRVNRAASLEALHFTGGARTSQNLLVSQFAGALDSAIRATDSAVRKGRVSGLRAIYRATSIALRLPG